MNYCPNCGQENHKVTVGLKLLVSDFFKDYLTFDSKIFRSLKPLLISPGELTQKFSEGKRSSYVPPVRLYLFISFIFFFISSLDYFSEGESSSNPFSNLDKANVADTTAVADSVANNKTTAGGLNFSVTDGATETNKLFQEGLARFNELPQKSQDEAIMGGISFMMFVILPIYAFVLLLLFFRKKKFYVEHLVFAFHIHSFYFLMFLVDTLIGGFYSSLELTFVFVLGMMFYTYKAIKKVYQPIRWKAVLQTSVLFSVHAFLIMVGLIGTFLIILLKA